jgi:hypothetical protein
MMAAIGTLALDRPELKSPDITLRWTADYGFRSGLAAHLPAGANDSWIAMKRRRYVDRARCKAPILVAPNRIDVRIDLRAQNGW